MDSKNSFLNKIYYPLFYVAVGLLSLIGLLVAVRPVDNFGGALSNVFFAITLPGLFLVGRWAKKSIKLDEVLLGIGLIVGSVVLISMISTWLHYGLFHTLIYKDTPIYYINAVPYDVTNEVMFFSEFRFQEVTVNYAGAFQLMAAAFIPGSFFIDRKQNKIKFIVSLVIGAIGFVALATVPNFKALIILAVVSGFALVYKFYWQNKTVIKTIKYVIWGLLALAIIFYLISGINVLAGRKFVGFLDKLCASNPIMSKVCDIMEVDGSYANLFGLSFVNVVTSDIEAVVALESGIFEVELLKEIGSIGVTLALAFIVISFISFDKSLSDTDETDFEKVTAVVFLAATFIYNSLFYSSLPRVFSTTYSQVLRFLPFMVTIFLLGMLYFTPNKGEKEAK